MPNLATTKILFHPNTLAVTAIVGLSLLGGLGKPNRALAATNPLVAGHFVPVCAKIVGLKNYPEIVVVANRVGAVEPADNQITFQVKDGDCVTSGDRDDYVSLYWTDRATLTSSGLNSITKNTQLVPGNCAGGCVGDVITDLRYHLLIENLPFSGEYIPASDTADSVPQLYQVIKTGDGYKLVAVDKELPVYTGLPISASSEDMLWLVVAVFLAFGAWWGWRNRFWTKLPRIRPHIMP